VQVVVVAQVNSAQQTITKDEAAAIAHCTTMKRKGILADAELFVCSLSVLCIADPFPLCPFVIRSCKYSYSSSEATFSLSSW
jgi:hypothetical protein